MTETEQGKVLWSDQVEEEMPSEGVYDFEENITIVNIGGRTFRKANVARKRCCAPVLACTYSFTELQHQHAKDLYIKKKTSSVRAMRYPSCQFSTRKIQREGCHILYLSTYPIYFISS